MNQLGSRRGRVRAAQTRARGTGGRKDREEPRKAAEEEGAHEGQGRRGQGGRRGQPVGGGGRKHGAVEEEEAGQWEGACVPAAWRGE